MNEVREGRPLVGPSGEINWQLAARYGQVYRAGAYVTNWSKVPLAADAKKNMTADEKREWTELLEAELAQVKPELVIALGGYAVEALLGPGHSLFWSNGIPIRRAQDDFVVVPVVHPAAGMHESGMLYRTVQGYEGVRAYREGKIQARSGWAPAPTVGVLPRPTTGRLNIGIDTEGTKAKPFMLQWSLDGEVAEIIYATEHEKIRDFVAYLYSVRASTTLYIHRVLWDAGVLRSMAQQSGTRFEVWDFEVRDTAVLAFNLQNLPTDLKNLSRVVLNREMTDYLEVVRPWREAAERTWRARGYEQALKHLTLEQQFTPTGKPRLQKKQPVFKWAGPQLMLSLKNHVERDQQLSGPEEKWVERTIGEPKPGDELRLVPKQEAEDYAGRDASNTVALGPELDRRAEAEGLAACAALDHSVLPLAEDMQNAGLNLDIERYWEVLGDISVRRRAVIEEIREIVAADGYPADEFNPGSSPQVADFCKFMWTKEHKLGLTKRTKSGMADSTESNVLMQLHDEHVFIPKILEYRELDKYENTYLLPLQPLIRQVGRDEWRVFVELLVTNVVSGRFASANPNALAWPARTKLGLKIRSIFRARPGYILVSWDLSQIELRLLAALSKDPVMLEAFLSGLDLHTNLAAKTFHKTYEECDSGPGRLLYRTPAKTTHYGMVYGAQWQTLFEELRGQGITFFSKQACKDMIRDTWKLYAGASRFLKGTAQEAREKGFVSDPVVGRRRFLPGCRLVGDDWPLAGLRYEAERQAGNFKIQTPASSIIKRSMDTVWNTVYPRRASQGWDFRLWLQIHDELMGELQEGHFEEADQMMKAALSQDSWLTDPIKIEVEGKFGQAWSDLK